MQKMIVAKKLLKLAKNLVADKYKNKKHPSQVPGLEVVQKSKGRGISNVEYLYKGKPAKVFDKRLTFDDGVMRIVTIIKDKTGGKTLWTSHNLDKVKKANVFSAAKPPSDVKKHKKSINQLMTAVDTQIGYGDFEKAARFTEGVIVHLKLLAKALRTMKGE